MNESALAASPPAVQRAKRAFLVLFIITCASLVLVIAPLLVGLFLSVVLAALLWPVQRFLTARFKGRSRLSAVLLVLGVLFILVGPVVGFSAFIIRESRSGIAFVVEIAKSKNIAALIERLPEPLERWGKSALEQLPQNQDELQDVVEQQLVQRGTSAATAVGSAMAATGSLLFQLTVMLIALFFFLVQGAELVAWLDAASPLLPGQTRELLAEVKSVATSVVISTLATAGVQTVAATIGYFIAQVPHPLFFATLTFFIAFIPAIGAGTVCCSAAALLLATGHTGMGIFLGIWGLTIVALVDNVLKPFLIRGGRVALNGGVVFFSLIGGLAAFGALGLLLGPLTIAVFLSMVRMYRRDFSKEAPVQTAASVIEAAEGA